MSAVKPRYLVSLIGYALLSHLGLLLCLQAAWLPGLITLIFAQAWFWLGQLRRPTAHTLTLWTRLRWLGEALLFPGLSLSALLAAEPPWVWLLPLPGLLLSGIALAGQGWQQRHPTPEPHDEA
ncbi:MAG: hypothetical protein IGS03_12020 [Candidatus Sericytochromatia bacterium]|nr:hypothetical protein [Candidatus Sericytochromatia bacterium]